MRGLFSSPPPHLLLLSLRYLCVLRWAAAANGISHERDSGKATLRFATKVAPQSRLTAAIAFVVVSILSTLSADMFSQSATQLEIRTLSSRPDMVSGGDALVEVKGKGKCNALYPVKSSAK